jgi:thiol-disulfide isomerase/thioredoxin
VKGTAALLLLVTFLAATGIWAGLRLERRARSLPPEDPPGEQITIRFFRNPTAVKAFTVHDLDGHALASADLRGKVVLVNFWATWCGPCRAEIPDLVALQKKYREHLQIIGVSEDEGPTEPVRRFAAEHGVNYPVVMLTPELEQIFAGVSALPTTFVIDRDGRLVQRHVGLLTSAVTEMETRALAGLSTHAKIEHVDRAQPVKLENAAQATSIPGIDLASLSVDRRATALQRLNEEPCTCGCDLMVAKCRIDDPTCGVSLPIARRIVAQLDTPSK